MGNVFSMNDIRGRADDALSTEYVWTVGKALAEWLPEEGAVVIAKSADANSSTVHALVEGLLLQGRDVIDAGQIDQVSLTNIIGEKQAAGGVLVAHDDIQGMEILTIMNAQGVLVTADTGLMEIGELVSAGNFVPAADKGDVTTL